MKMSEFIAIMKREYNATMDDIKRLNEEGMQSAYDAHIDAYEAGEMSGITSRDDFIDHCYFIGRDFVIDNMGDIFKLTD